MALESKIVRDQGQASGPPTLDSSTAINFGAQVVQIW